MKWNKTTIPNVTQIVHFSPLLRMATRLPKVKQMFLSTDAQEVAHKQPNVDVRGA
jgi:hypothetical protein